MMTMTEKKKITKKGKTMKMNNQVFFLLCFISTPLLSTSTSGQRKKDFQARFRAAYASRMKEHEERNKNLVPDAGASLDDEMTQLRMKIRQIYMIPDEEPTYAPEILAGGTAAFLGANGLAQANSARFIIEAGVALTTIKLAAAVAASSYIIYKIRHFMRDDEGAKKLKKEYKEDMTAWKREFSHQLGKIHEEQEKFHAEQRQDFNALKVETKATYERRKQKTKDMLATEFAKQREIIDKGLNAATKKIDEKIKEKKDLSASEKATLQKMIDKLQAQMIKDREQFNELLAEQKELGKKEKEQLLKTISELEGILAEAKGVRELQAREVGSLHEAVSLIERGSYKKFMAELDKVKKTMEETPKRTFMDRLRGRPGHSRGVSLGGTSSSPDTAARSSSMTEDGTPGSGRPILRPGVKRLSLGNLDLKALAELARESARAEGETQGTGNVG